MEGKKKYTTEAGDTWDLIAFKVYGSEKYAQLLMENNYDYLDIIVFDSGAVLNVPEPADDNGEDDLPEWRRS